LCSQPGVLVDRRTPRRRMPLSPAPTILACAVLAATDSRLDALAFFSMLGVESGLMPVIHWAVRAEVYREATLISLLGGYSARTGYPRSGHVAVILRD